MSNCDKATAIIGKFGLKQGANVRNQKLIKNFRTDICHQELLKAFISLIGVDIRGISYGEIKDLNEAYIVSKGEIKRNLLGGWTDPEFKGKFS